MPQRQHGYRTQPAHGPGLLRRRNVMHHDRWCDALFLHYSVDAAALQAKLPAGLTVDNYRGAALVSVVALSECGYAPVCPVALMAWLLQPLRGSHHVVSVRTYVRPTNGNGPPGMYYFTTECSSWLPSAGARLFFNLPYKFACVARRYAIITNSSSTPCASHCPCCVHVAPTYPPLPPHPIASPRTDGLRTEGLTRLTHRTASLHVEVCVLLVLLNWRRCLFSGICVMLIDDLSVNSLCLCSRCTATPPTFEGGTDGTIHFELESQMLWGFIAFIVGFRGLLCFICLRYHSPFFIPSVVYILAVSFDCVFCIYTSTVTPPTVEGGADGTTLESHIWFDFNFFCFCRWLCFTPSVIYILASSFDCVFCVYSCTVIPPAFVCATGRHDTLRTRVVDSLGPHGLYRWLFFQSIVLYCIALVLDSVFCVYSSIVIPPTIKGGTDGTIHFEIVSCIELGCCVF